MHEEFSGEIEFDGEIDLHFFSAKDIPHLLNTLIEESLRKGKSEVRIIHGKGKSFKKTKVHEYLSADPRVSRFSDDAGNWGATIARITSTT